jgi:hypothetical protein
VEPARTLRRGRGRTLREMGWWQGLPSELHKLVGMFRGFSSTFRASILSGRSTRLAKKGRTQEAFELVCKALAVLRQPTANRATPPAQTIILFATLHCEQLAEKLGVPSGATRDDLETALALAKSWSDNPKSAHEVRGWREWLESRLEGQEQQLPQIH